VTDATQTNPSRCELVIKRIVVTGASGNVGTALLRRLTEADADYEITGIARREPPPKDVYRHSSGISWTWPTTTRSPN
jgi:NAD dependent epimerase/dehydratase family enzyme